MKEILLVLIPTLTLVPTAVAATLAMRKISSSAKRAFRRWRSGAESRLSVRPRRRPTSATGSTITDTARGCVGA